MRDSKKDTDLRANPRDEEVSGKATDRSNRQQELDEVVARLRNSDIDIRDYIPDLDTIMREAHPARRAAKLREALDLERDVTLRQSLSEIATLRAERDPARLERRLREVIARARTSEVELGEYFPDLETISREVDPALRAKRLRSALDNPEIDEALAGARTSLARLDRATPNRGSVASPWAQQAPELGAIDKAALPSAMMPFSPVAEIATDTEHAATLDKAPALVAARPSRRWTIAQSVMAVIAVVAPLTMMYFLLVWRKDPGPAISAPAAASVAPLAPSGRAPSPSVAPTALPSVDPPAVPVAVSAAPLESSAPAPSASAVAPPGAVPALRPKPGKQNGDPYDGAVPAPLKTAEPAPPPPATVVPAAPPPSPSASSHLYSPVPQY